MMLPLDCWTWEALLRLTRQDSETVSLSQNREDNNNDNETILNVKTRGCNFRSHLEHESVFHTTQKNFACPFTCKNVREFLNMDFLFWFNSTRSFCSSMKRQTLSTWRQMVSYVLWKTYFPLIRSNHVGLKFSLRSLNDAVYTSDT